MSDRKTEYFDMDTPRQTDVPEQISEKQKAEKAQFTSGVIVGLAGALLILGIVFLGTRLADYIKMQNNPLLAQAEDLEFTEESAVSPTLVNKLQNMEEVIEKYFYLREVTDEELEEGIYKGMLAALDDPYSEYYTAEELNDLMTQTEGIYYGIGAYVSLDEDTSLPKIAGVIEGAPAEDAQLRANDLIYEVDGESMYDKSLAEAVALIKGKEGTIVELTIIREGESDYLMIPVTRAKVESPTVNFEMLDETTAYIQIVEFDEITVTQFEEALVSAKASGMEGLILDLRANPGGSLTSVVEIARMILPEGIIVYTKDKYGKGTEYTCDGSMKLDVPLVTLIDMNSASAAEILAGCIQDYDLGTLVGTTTFGKGIVQQVIPFSDGSALKVTTSSYFTPNGRDIHEIGIEPDIVCEFDGEAYYEQENPVDNQLEKAKEVLEKISN